MYYNLSYSNDLLPILVTLTLLVILVLWNVIVNFKSTNWLWVFLLVPLTLISAVTIYQRVSDLLGYAVWLKIPDDSLYRWHEISIDQTYISVVVIPNGELKERMYAIQNTDDNREKMEKAAEADKKGIPQMIAQNSEESHDGETNGGEYVLYDFQLADDQNLKQQQE